MADYLDALNSDSQKPSSRSGGDYLAALDSLAPKQTQIQSDTQLAQLDQPTGTFDQQRKPASVSLDFESPQEAYVNEPARRVERAKEASGTIGPQKAFPSGKADVPKPPMLPSFIKNLLPDQQVDVPESVNTFLGGLKGKASQLPVNEGVTAGEALNRGGELYEDIAHKPRLPLGDLADQYIASGAPTTGRASLFGDQALRGVANAAEPFTTTENLALGAAGVPGGPVVQKAASAYFADQALTGLENDIGDVASGKKTPIEGIASGLVNFGIAKGALGHAMSGESAAPAEETKQGASPRLNFLRPQEPVASEGTNLQNAAQAEELTGQQQLDQKRAAAKQERMQQPAAMSYLDALDSVPPAKESLFKVGDEVPQNATPEQLSAISKAGFAIGQDGRLAEKPIPPSPRVGEEVPGLDQQAEALQPKKPIITPPPPPIKGLLPAPEPPKPYEMSYEDLDSAAKQSRLDDDAMLVNVFGEEGAKKYKRLGRISQSSTAWMNPESDARQKAADKELAAMDEGLTDYQRSAIYGEGSTAPTAEDYSDFRHALGQLDQESPQALGRSLRWAVTDIGDATDPAKMNHRQQIAYAQLREAFRFANEQGWDTKQVSDAALKASARRFSDPNDAAFMLQGFIKERPPTVPEQGKLPSRPPNKGLLTTSPQFESSRTQSESTPENAPQGDLSPRGEEVAKTPESVTGQQGAPVAQESAPSQAEVHPNYEQIGIDADSGQPILKQKTERRLDTSERKRVSEMSPDEMQKELLTSESLNLPNKRAFLEEEARNPSPAISMSDADGLKAFNDKFGYEYGNKLLEAKAEALKEAGLDAYHDKGDEFLQRDGSPADLQKKLETAREILRNKEIEVELNDGTIKRYKGVDFSYGVGKDLSEAEANLKQHKADRESAGQRARGELRGITEVGPQAGEVPQGSQLEASPARAEASQPKSSVSSRRFSPGDKVIISGNEMHDASGKAAAAESGTVERFTPASEKNPFNSAVVRTPDGREIRLSYREGGESPIRAEGEAAPIEKPKAATPTSTAKKPHELTEKEFVDQAMARKIKNYEGGIKRAEEDAAKLGPRATKAKAEAESNIGFWKKQLERIKAGTYDTTDVKRQYFETVKEAISTGQEVPKEIIAQKPEFTKAVDARARYDKGRHTSFANKSIAVDEALKESHGVKIKRQDGKPIMPEQADEIGNGVADMEEALGKPINQLLRKSDITIAHTNGKHPFLRDSGGLYNTGEKTVSMGVKDVLGRPINALGHEIAHWLDYESGAALGSEARARVGSKYASISALSEGDYRKSGDNLLRTAERSMSHAYDARNIMKLKYEGLTPEEHAEAERVKVHLGSYWHEPREIWARLVEEYIAKKLDRKNLATDSLAYYQNAPGYWSAEEFAKLEPKVEAEIARRVDALDRKYETKDSRFITRQSYLDAKKSFLDKVTRSSAGVDVSAVKDLAVIGAYHFENGVRTFAEWSKKMVAELGEAVRPHLTKVWNGIQEKVANGEALPSTKTQAPASKLNFLKQAEEIKKPQPKAQAAPPQTPNFLKPKTAGSAPEPERAGNINLSKFNVTDAAKQLIKAADVTGEGFEEQRRGVQSHEKTQSLAAKLGLTSDELARTRKGSAFNAEELHAAGNLLASSAENMRKLQDKAAKTGSVDDQIAVLEAYAKHVSVQQAVSGATAEAGRALNALKIIRQAQDVAGKDNRTKVLDALRENLGEDWVNRAEAITKKVSQFPEGDTVGLNKFLRESVKVPLGQMLNNYFLANLLSGPKTPIKKGLGDLALAALQHPQRVLEGAIDLGRAKLTGKPQEHFIREALPAATAYFGAFPKALQKFAYIMRNGFTPEQAAVLEAPGINELPGGLKNPLNLSTRWLSATAEMYKAMALEGELNAQAVRQALKEGASGQALDKRIHQLVTERPPELIDKAIKQAKLETYTTDADGMIQLAKRAQQIYTVPEDFAIKPLRGFQPGRVIIPFSKVPWNIAKMGIEYGTPARALSFLSKEGRSPQNFAPNAAKAIIGSSIFAIGYGLAQQGNLTGPMPKDPKEKERFLGEGRQPYSFKVGNKWISYHVLPPLAIGWAAAAAMHDNNQDPALERIADTGAAVAKSIVDASFFAGLNNAMEAINGYQAGGGSVAHNFGQGAKSLTGNVVSGFVPLSSLLRQVTHAKDSTVRDADTIYERVKANLPILSEELPAKRDRFGRPVQRLGDTGAAAFLPIQPAESGPLSRVDEEVDRLGIKVQEPSSRLSVGNQKYDLTKDQERDLRTMTGQQINSALSELYASGRYQELTDDKKQLITQRVMDAVRERARVEYIKKIAGENIPLTKHVRPNFLPQAEAR